MFLVTFALAFRTLNEAWSVNALEGPLMCSKGAEMLLKLKCACRRYTCTDI